MLMLTAVAAGSALILPVLQSGSVQPSFEARMNEGGAAATKVKLTISSTGKPMRCDTMFSNGPESNGRALCDQLLKEAHFSPAVDSEGAPIASFVIVWSHWSKGRWGSADEPSWDPIDLGFEVNRLPAGMTGIVTFHLTLQANSAGTVEVCEIAEAVPKQLKDLLCTQASAFPLKPVLNTDSQPVASVRPYRARVTTTTFMDGVMKDIKKLK